ncbi:hypothetical protein VE03_03680 [Pseudogymnoascus sp. 23342-1-I1]|nr:hypothetical protein VE03_03573 [Pseudogymnoascus sp. 23342-1-I1]OBT66522.1 hypothetical protein VE03_03680 [Pseudogymnoascus sp. 23342-1-I1]
MDAPAEPVIIPMLEQYTDDTSVLAKYLLEEMYRDYHHKRLVFIAAPERRLVYSARWHREMRTRIKNLIDGLPGLERDKLVFVAILSVSQAFMEALTFSTDDLWILTVELLTANKSSIEFYARSRGLSWLRAVRELIPRLHRNPEKIWRAFDDHVVGHYPSPNGISDEVLQLNLNHHGPDTFYLSMTGKIVPIEAPRYSDYHFSGLQIINIDECVYDHDLFSQYSRTPDWPWQTWPRHPQICDAPDIDGLPQERACCVECGHRFSGEEEWHDANIGCQCHDRWRVHQDVMIQIVEYPPFPNQPDVVNRGVRALQSLSKNYTLGEYTGVLQPNVYDPGSEISDDTYQFALHVYDRTVANISARLYGNWTRFINHADDEAKQNVKFSLVRILNRVRVVVTTIKDIEAGEELLGDYGPAYFFSRQL